MKKEENKEEQPTVTKAETLPCGCKQTMFSNGTGQEIPCIMHSLMRAGQLIAHVGETMMRDKMRAQQQIHQAAVNQIMAEQKKGKNK